MADLTALAEELSTLNAAQIGDLRAALEMKWGIKTPKMSQATQPGRQTDQPPVVEEQAEYTVLLTDVGANKMQVIKVVRETTGLGLKESKEMTEALPKEVKTGISKAEADDLAAKLTAQGAKVEVK